MTRVTTFPVPFPPPPTAPSGRGGEGARRRKQPAASADPASPSTPHSLLPRSLLKRAILLPPPAKTLSGSWRLEARPGTGVLWSRLTTPLCLPDATLAAGRLHFPGSIAPESRNGACRPGAMHAGPCSPAGMGTRVHLPHLGLHTGLRLLCTASLVNLASNALRPGRCAARVSRSDPAVLASLGSAIEGRRKPKEWSAT